MKKILTVGLLNFIMWFVFPFLLILKIIGAIDISWWWVFSPILVPVAIAVIVGIILGLYDDYQSMKKRRR